MKKELILHTYGHLPVGSLFISNVLNPAGKQVTMRKVTNTHAVKQNGDGDSMGMGEPMLPHESVELVWRGK